MLVDDNADVRFLIRAITEDAGGDVVVAGDAGSCDEALERVDAVDPDVVVLDAMMPVHDGFTTAARIRERRPQQLILLCSAVVDDATRERTATAGITACLSKDAFEAIPGTALELVRQRDA